MLGFPKSTELKRQLYKNAIYSQFNMDTAAKERFDNDIKKITIVNEISPKTTLISKGEKVDSFFVLHILLKKVDFDEKNIILILKLIKQNMLFILEYENKAKLAVYNIRLLQTDWEKTKDISVQLKGLNLDQVWENIIIQVSDVVIEQGKTLEEQIELDEKRKKIQKQILTLEKLARTEKQPKKKFEIVEEIRKLKIKL
ncbi:MAG TPA: DUF4391 domain-containing protein [Clostridiales bacterium]|jgi:hypothetical protein|nr:DUF4391 domain-containing protein [Clostridiales bacterium]